MVEGASCFSNIEDGSLVVWSRVSLQLRKWRVSRVVQGTEQDVFYNEDTDSEITWPPESVCVCARACACACACARLVCVCVFLCMCACILVCVRAFVCA
jgi:hypothetical protein